MSAAVSMAPDVLLDRQARRESNARTCPRRLPLALVHGEGVHVTDGRTYLDSLAGAGTLNLGHNHPVVLEASARRTAGLVDAFFGTPGRPLSSPAAAPDSYRLVRPSGAQAGHLLPELHRGQQIVRDLPPLPAEETRRRMSARA
jgi:hypothetical protein